MSFPLSTMKTENADLSWFNLLIKHTLKHASPHKLRQFYVINLNALTCLFQICFHVSYHFFQSESNNSCLFVIKFYMLLCNSNQAMNHMESLHTANKNLPQNSIHRTVHFFNYLQLSLTFGPIF